MIAEKFEAAMKPMLLLHPALQVGLVVVGALLGFLSVPQLRQLIGQKIWRWIDRMANAFWDRAYRRLKQRVMDWLAQPAVVRARHCLWVATYTLVAAFVVGVFILAVALAQIEEETTATVPLVAKSIPGHWTTAEDWSTWEHHGTSVSGNSLTLAREPATWAKVEGVPSGQGAYSDVSTSGKGNVWISNPLSYSTDGGCNWVGVDNGATQVTAIFTRGVADTFWGDYLGEISRYDGDSVFHLHKLPGGGAVLDIDGDADNAVAVGEHGAVSILRNGVWDDSLFHPNGVKETFRKVKYLGENDMWWTGDYGHIYHYDGVAVVQLDTGVGDAPTALDGDEEEILVAVGDGIVRYDRRLQCFGVPEQIGLVSSLLRNGPNDVWAVDGAAPGDNFVHRSAEGWSLVGVNAVGVMAIAGNEDEMWAVGPDVVLKGTAGPYVDQGYATIAFTPVKGMKQKWLSPYKNLATPAGTSVEMLFSTDQGDDKDWTSELGNVPSSEMLHIQIALQKDVLADAPSVMHLQINRE